MFIAEIGESCYTVLGVLFFLKALLKIAYIVIPIGLIVMLSIDFFKGVISFEDSNSKIFSFALRRIVYTMFIFLIPTTVFALFNIIGISSKDSNSCWTYVDEVSTKEVRMIQDTNRDLLEAEIDKLREEIAENLSIEDKSKGLRRIVAKKSNGTSSNEGTVLGQKYDLTDKELNAIAYVCSREQGTPKGAAAEASLMANKYELEKSKKGLYKYLYDSTWFRDIKSRMDKANSIKVDSKIKLAVKDVLVNGNRTLPLYIDEHDYFGDIGKIKVNGHTYTSSSEIKNRKNYIKDKTVIYNNMTSTYIFYTFPDENNKDCDPFGYHESAKKQVEKLNK